MDAAEFARRQIAIEQETLVEETSRLHELTTHLQAAAQRGGDITGDAAALHQRLAGITQRAARIKAMRETASLFIGKEI